MLIEITYNVTDVYMSTTETPVYVEISFEQPGGGAAVWGSITGTLSNQTDLQNALNAKFDDPTGTTAQYIRGDGTLATFPSLTGYVPYTGATTNVDLGEYELKAGQLTLDVSPTGTAAVGTTRWNDTTGVSETTLKGGNVLLRNGVDLVARVVNKVTPNTTLTKAAYQAVRVSGAQGQRLAVAFAQANNDANSADTIGLVIETIPTNQEGFIMAVGQLENINTTGSLQGETWVDGDVLYLSPTTAGAITNVKPTGNGHIVVIGYVEYAHANNGKIYIKILNGWELTELHDVDIVSPANNEALIYESSSALWKNKSIATALGYTPANAATTLTINGVTYDLSTSRTWTISAGISGTIATGQVAYATAANTIGGSNNLFWDNSNGRLGIGTNAPSNKLVISGSETAASGFARGILINTTLNAATNSDLLIGLDIQPVMAQGAFTNASPVAMRLFNPNTNAALDYGIQFRLQNTRTGQTGTDGFLVSIDNSATPNAYIYNYENASIIFGTNSTVNARLYQSGNFVLQNGGTFSDGGQRLQVIGDTLLRGSGATSATTALTVQNSSSTNLFTVRNDARVGIATNAPTAALDIWNATDNAQLRISDSRVSIPDYSGVAFSPAMSNRTLGFLSPWSSSTGGVQFSGFTTNTNTGTPFAFVGIHGGTSPTTPALRLRGWKHNGTTGLAVLTGSEIIAGFNTGNNADVFQVKANGTINMSSLPTSATGLVAGDLWNDAGTIKIV